MPKIRVFHVQGLEIVVCSEVVPQNIRFERILLNYLVDATFDNFVSNVTIVEITLKPRNGM